MSLSLPFLMTAADASPNGMVAVDPSRTILAVNETLSRVLGYEPGELTGQSARVIYPDDDVYAAQGSERVTPSLPAAGETYDIVLKRRDGTTFPTVITTRPVHEDGALLGFVSVISDRTDVERRTAFLQNVLATCAEATLNLEQKVGLLLGFGADYFRLDIGIVALVEGERYEVAHVHGGGSTIAVGDVFALKDTYCEMVLAANNPQFFRHASESAHARHPCYANTGLEAYIGTPLLVRGRRVGTLNFSSPTPRERPFSDEEQSLMMTLAAWVGNEIGIKQQGETLIRERERFRRRYRRTPAIMHTLNDAYEIQDLSDLWQERLGYSFAEMRGRPPMDIMSEESVAGVAALAQVFERDGHLARIPMTFVAKSGEPVETELSAIREDGSIYVVLDDVGERNEAARELERLNDELIRSNTSLREFAYVASHDLQEPLRKITQFSSFLVEDHGDALGDEGRYMLDSLSSAATRMSALIRDLLAYSRANNVELDMARCDLATVVEEVLGEFDLALEESGATVERGGLPVVRADAVQLNQLMRNLIGNALKYRSPDRTLVLRIEAEEGAGEGEGKGKAEGTGEGIWVVRVADNGIGFDPRHAETILEPFRRLHTHSQYQGSGIGLALCKAICERHGWAFVAQGNPGAGATFSVHIPKLR